MIDYEKALIRLLFIPIHEFFLLMEKMEAEDFNSDDYYELEEMQHEFEMRARKNLKKIIELLRIKKNES